MTDITNEQRAGWAAIAVLQYAIIKEGGMELYDDPETVLVDLLCDLMHYADLKKLLFTLCQERARTHYVEELKESLDNQHGLRCPVCEQSDEIDIAASVWVRLCPDGTDVTAAENGDHEWENSSTAKCSACGYCSTVAAFEVTP